MNTVPAAIFIRNLILSNMWPRCSQNIGEGYLGQQQNAEPAIILRSSGFIIVFFEKLAGLRKQTGAISENLRRNIQKALIAPDRLFLTHNILHNYETLGMTVTYVLPITAIKFFPREPRVLPGIFR